MVVAENSQAPRDNMVLRPDVRNRLGGRTFDFSHPVASEESGNVVRAAIPSFSITGGSRTSPSYFIDGVAFKWPPEAVLTELERLLRPTDVLGIEIYRSEQRTPPPFSMSTGCGVIAIWRR